MVGAREIAVIVGYDDLYVVHASIDRGVDAMRRRFFVCFTRGCLDARSRVTSRLRPIMDG
jgi:hypothetical protein